MCDRVSVGQRLGDLRLQSASEPCRWLSELEEMNGLFNALVAKPSASRGCCCCRSLLYSRSLSEPSVWDRGFAALDVNAGVVAARRALVFCISCIQLSGEERNIFRRARVLVCIV